MALRSMTGFGQAAGESARYRVRVTLRSVNHRFLDLAIRLRDDQRTSEPALREVLAGRLARGRVEVNVDVEALGTPPHRLEVDRQALHELTHILDGLVEEEILERGLTAGDLLRLPQIVQLSEEERHWEAGDERLLLEVAGRALEQLVGARELEGGKLAAVLGERLDGLGAAADELREAIPRAREEAVEALRQRLEALLGERELDEQRLAQEVAVLADKSDVAEEVDRLGAHLEHFHEVMEAGGPVGKRLDFLTQEIFRELNTLGAKGRSSGITRVVLDAKVLCEQLREQVQNVE